MTDIQSDPSALIDSGETIPPAPSTTIDIAVFHSGERYHGFRTDIDVERDLLNQGITWAIDKGRPFDVVHVKLTVEELWALVHSDAKERIAQHLHAVMTTGLNGPLGESLAEKYYQGQVNQGQIVIEADTTQATEALAEVSTALGDMPGAPEVDATGEVMADGDNAQTTNSLG